MNIRSLTRGDGAVIGAAVLLLIASFLGLYAADRFPPAVEMPTLWASGPVLFGVVVPGLAGAALVSASRGPARSRKVAGLDVGQFGTALTVFAALSGLGNVLDPGSGMDNVTGTDPGVGAGLMLAFVATVIMAGAAVATPLVPALTAPLVPASRPVTQPHPQGPSQSGYGYPEAGQRPYGGGSDDRDRSPEGQSGSAPRPAQGFAPFWFAVPVHRPLFAEDGTPSPIAELAPGTWYLAVDQRGSALVAQTQDGRRGVLQDTSGIQRG
ncbi:hypothetical protein AAH978_02685 [Streptomyces sp. ZYX-F-203]